LLVLSLKIGAYGSVVAFKNENVWHAVADITTVRKFCNMILGFITDSNTELYFLLFPKYYWFQDEGV
jgi:hypothetical protein